MKFLGLIALLLVIAAAASFMASNTANVTQTNNTDDMNSVLDSARTAADQLGNVAPNGPQVEVYDGISVPNDAINLDLSGRGLDGSLKAEIRQVSTLEVLDISNNNFTGLPAEIGQLSSLRVLNVSNNPLTGLPYELGNLSNLQTLNLRGTNYAEQDLEIIRQNLPTTTEILID